MNDFSSQSATPTFRPFPKIGDKAPDFSARTTLGELTLSDLRGQWAILFAHPADFTPVCTSEFIALAAAAPEFAAMDCALIGLSIDSVFSHLAWIEAIRAEFGVKIPFPIAEDPSMAVSRAYGMLDDASENSATIRAVYVIDPEGVIRAIQWYPPTVGRSVDELKRLLAALQLVTARPVLTPEGWRPGEPPIAPPPEIQRDFARLGPRWFLQEASAS
ncbi:peroxiredoxin [Acetobacter nitrogenifigens DSM 23921 = NBRC 105050]|uniref:Alkyl hydroperoxide reductase C n=1 Tax=Acetobacter nitrogenifigens DSM 23921 = NBRC 105050 TaxID=1120919 RepID=A0A511XB33_9PROT|nr:peroxiredoxin [Acetobacter nitrogenifigens]GBQ88223.1 peroxiredoxin [Acetobacter nitrogenifigens DSM 23921 = NBRC 105050]GEN60112.1 peroxiredoxin [Acetobacter nitrogenifigens DSM 23921 = NBRC 105050]